MARRRLTQRKVPPIEDPVALMEQPVQPLAPYQRKLNKVRQYQHEMVRMERDIAPLPIDQIDWSLRNACEKDLKLFCESYLTATFYLDWSKDQLKCLAKAERVFLDIYKFALAMPRGGGKTAICRASILWGTLFGHKVAPTFIGAKEGNAKSTLKAIKTQLYKNKKLLRDFPEIAYPIYRIENRYHMAKGQLFNGEPTAIEWGSNEVRYPSLLLPEEVADVYLKHNKNSLRYLPDLEGFISPSAGVMLSTIGIDGSFRGENQVHPLTLEEIRPDIILLDDIQNDKKALSPISVQKLIQLVDGAVEGLAGPDKGISILMPCTVIMEGDVSDTYVDPAKRPDYNGERCKLVLSWPPGITDTEITKDTPAGVAWNEYIDLRNRSLRIYGDNRLATDYYQANQELMNENFVVSWNQRIVKEIAVSAQQNAMELRLKHEATFLSEFQNIGRSVVTGSVDIISAETLKNKCIELPRRFVPYDSQEVVAYIDVQDEMLYWGVAAASYDFTGAICDYGTWPEVKSILYTRDQANSWNMISKQFLDLNPQYLKKAVLNRRGRLKAPVGPKTYYAVSSCIRMLKEMVLTKGDQDPTPVKIKAIGIDGRHETDIIKQVVRELRDPNIHVCFGQSYPTTNRQLDEYERTPGWIFEDQKNPSVKQCKWVRKIGKDFFPYISWDSDLLKDFLFKRLATAIGSPASISLFKASPEQHMMFAAQVCDSEYPEEITARGISKNHWQERDNGPDNEYLDICYGLMGLLSYQGCCPKITREPKPTKQKRSLRAMWEAKHRKG